MDVIDSAGARPGNRAGDVGGATVASVLERIRATRPLVHASMNSVAEAFVANVVTALGADVSMTAAADEVGEMVERSAVLLVNLGTLDPARREGIVAAVAAAGRAGVPFVLDPVKVDRAPRRRAFAEDLLGASPAIVKGNAAEMAVLDGLAASGAACVTTGAADMVRQGDRRVMLSGGTPLLARVIATGCAAGAVVAAARAVEDDPFLAAVAGLAIFKMAAEAAAGGAAGPGSFAVGLLDRLWALSPEAVKERFCLSDG